MALGIALSLVAAVGFGLGNVLVRRAIFSVSPAIVLLLSVTTVTLVLGILTFTLSGRDAFSQDASFYGMTALMGFLANIFGALMFFHALDRIGATRATPILGAAPLFAILLAVVIGGERPGAVTLAGAVIIVSGVAILVTDRRAVGE